jgi:hypothetical protein
MHGPWSLESIHQAYIKHVKHTSSISSIHQAYFKHTSSIHEAYINLGQLIPSSVNWGHLDWFMQPWHLPQWTRLIAHCMGLHWRPHLSVVMSFTTLSTIVPLVTFISRVGQNRIYTPYIWWIPCQKYRICTVYIWFWPTLFISVASSFCCLFYLFTFYRETGTHLKPSKPIECVGTARHGKRRGGKVWCDWRSNRQAW